MKRLGSFLALLFISSQSFSALYECSNGEGSDALSFFLALDNKSSGLVYKRAQGDPIKTWHELIEGTTLVTHTARAGFTRVSISPPDRDIDWANEEGCWVRIGATYDFHLNRSESEVELFGVIKVNPDVPDCDVPNFQRRIETLSCQLK